MNKDNQPKKTEQSAKTGKKSGKGRRVGQTIGIVLGTILLVTVLTSAIFVGIFMTYVNTSLKGHVEVTGVQAGQARPSETAVAPDIPGRLLAAGQSLACGQILGDIQNFGGLTGRLFVDLVAWAASSASGKAMFSYGQWGIQGIALEHHGDVPVGAPCRSSACRRWSARRRRCPPDRRSSAGWWTCRSRRAHQHDELLVRNVQG